MYNATNHPNVREGQTNDSSSLTSDYIGVDKLYLSHLLEVDQKCILITSIYGCETIEHKIPLKLEHCENFNVLLLNYKGRKFYDYFPRNATFKLRKILLKKSNESSLEDRHGDVHDDNWAVISIEAQIKSDCDYLLEKAVEDNLTAILAMQLEIINENNFSQKLTFHLQDAKGTPLHCAVRKGDIILIKILLDYGLNINARNQEGWTPLLIAIHLDMPDIVDFLTSNGADIDAEIKIFQSPFYLAVKNNYLQIPMTLRGSQQIFDEKHSCHHTPIFYAIMIGNKNVVDILLKKGANYKLTHQWSGTPFQMAVAQKNLDIIEVFLENYIDANILNSLKQTPIEYLSRKPIDFQSKVVSKEIYLKIINYFLQKGVNINFQDEHGRTYLHYAVLYENDECMQALLECNAYVTIENKFSENTLDLTPNEKENDRVVKSTLKENLDTNISDKMGKTALHIVVKQNRLAAVKLLLRNGADINLKNICGETPLHLAIESANLPIIELFLENKADINLMNTYGEIALHIAIESKSIPVIQFLLKKGAGVNLRDSKGQNALHVASENNIPIEIVQSILNSTDDIDGKDHFGNTALHKATLTCNINTLKYLLEKNADVNARNSDGRTPLHLISVRYWNKNCIECIKVLVDHKADVNAVDKDLINPLHLACLNKNVAVAKYLIENGADSSLRDKDGRTVFHYGCMVNKSYVPLPQFRDYKKKFEDYKKIQTKDILNLFIEEDVLVNCVDKFGKTPLHYVMEHGYDGDDITSIRCELLLKMGVDINVEDVNHNSVFDKFSELYYFSKNVTLQLCIRHIIQMKVMELPVCEKILHEVYTVDDVNHSKWIKRYERECQKEIDSMKTINIDQSNITYYNFMKKSLRNAVYYACNKNIVNAIKSNELTVMFPIYGHFLKCHLRKVQRLSYLYILIQKLSKSDIFKKLPILCIHEILGYLNSSELQKLLEAIKTTIKKVK